MRQLRREKQGNRTSEVDRPASDLDKPASAAAHRAWVCGGRERSKGS